MTLRHSKRFRDSIPSSGWASLDTHAPHQSRTPYGSLASLYPEEGKPFLEIIWLLQMSLFPPMPRLSPYDVPPSCHYVMACQERAGTFWRRADVQGPRNVAQNRSQKSPGGISVWTEGHFVHMMYYMGSGLQPENNLLFLLFPY